MRMPDGKPVATITCSCPINNDPNAIRDFWDKHFAEWREGCLKALRDSLARIEKAEQPSGARA